MTTETAIYSLEEVRNKCDGKNIWFVIHNSVYDVTNYLEEHPGGEELLLEQTGLDATEAFETFDHSDATTEAMKKYKIGELAEEDRVTFVKINRWDEYQEASRKRARYRLVSWLVAPFFLGVLATVVYRRFILRK